MKSIETSKEQTILNPEKDKKSEKNSCAGEMVLDNLSQDNY